jgi:hypothetical protein
VGCWGDRVMRARYDQEMPRNAEASSVLQQQDRKAAAAHWCWSTLPAAAPCAGAPDTQSSSGPLCQLHAKQLQHGSLQTSDLQAGGIRARAAHATCTTRHHRSGGQVSAHQLALATAARWHARGRLHCCSCSACSACPTQLRTWLRASRSLSSSVTAATSCCCTACMSVRMASPAASSSSLASRSRVTWG